jgi:hypothetical protein
MFRFEIECDNEVFTDYPADAIADALLAVSKQVRREGLYPNSAQWIRDNNGNRIGTFKYENRERLAGRLAEGTRQ